MPDQKCINWNKPVEGYIRISFILEPLIAARVEEEAARRNIQPGDLVNEILADEHFKAEFQRIPIPADVDLDDDEQVTGWVISAFVMALLPPSYRELQ